MHLIREMRRMVVVMMMMIIVQSTRSDLRHGRKDFRIQRVAKDDDDCAGKMKGCCFLSRMIARRIRPKQEHYCVRTIVAEVDKGAG